MHEEYTSLHLILYVESRGSRYSRKFLMWYRISLHGVPNILGNFACGTEYPRKFSHGVPEILGIFAWGTEYPRKFSIQDAVFPDLEGGSKFPGGIPFFLGKIVRGCRISWGAK